MTLVDTHAHYLSGDLPRLSEETGDRRWPHLEIDPGGGQGRIMRGADVFRRVRRELWDLSARLEELDRESIPVQVISPVPVTLVDWAEPLPAQRFLAAQNDRIAEAVAGSGGRLAGLGAVSLSEPEAAIAEMERCVGVLGLAGLEIATVNAGAELAAPRLRPFLSAAATRGVPLFVHPVDGAGAARCSTPQDAFGIGMLTDTAVAASNLVFGGVLAELPGLKVCLSHGGGSFTWAYPRLKMWATTIGINGQPADGDELDAVVRRLFVDSLVFDPDHVVLLARRYGPGALVFGSDHPFVGWEEARRALGSGPISAGDAARLSANAAAFYGLERVAG